MIFAAGIGSRLMPLTSDCPKALIPVNDKPMLQLIIQRIINLGINNIVVNTHHYSGKIKEFLKKNNNFNIHIDISDESLQLLDTGGGLKKAAPLFKDNDPILIHNVDIFTDINLPEMIEFHKSTNAMATLAVRKRKTRRYFLFDGSKRLVGWENVITGKKILTIKNSSTDKLAFSGIQIIQPTLFSRFPSKKVFSIVEAYLNATTSQPIYGFEHNEGTWIDAGKAEFLEPASNFVRTNNSLYT